LFGFFYQVENTWVPGFYDKLLQARLHYVLFLALGDTQERSWLISWCGYKVSSWTPWVVWRPPAQDHCWHVPNYLRGVATCNPSAYPVRRFSHYLALVPQPPCCSWNMLLYFKGHWVRNNKLVRRAWNLPWNRLGLNMTSVGQPWTFMSLPLF